MDFSIVKFLEVNIKCHETFESRKQLFVCWFNLLFYVPVNNYGHVEKVK